MFFEIQKGTLGLNSSVSELCRERFFLSASFPHKLWLKPTVSVFIKGGRGEWGKKKICKPIIIVEALSRDVCWLCTSAKISNEGRWNLLLLIMGRNSTNLIIYVDPSLSTKNQLQSASSAWKLAVFMARVGRTTWALPLSLLLLMSCCHAVQKLHSVNLQREEEKGNREEKKGRGRKGEKRKNGDERGEERKQKATT